MKKLNHLKSETSPYLLQHAHNPVDWYPWCDEAFERAAAEDKPVFLSIGYSTCHWCHVMAEETFENDKAARILNTHFISIKVDREERPDIDNVYMRACQLITGSGGWPMTIFMTPEREPFFAGTYFPAAHFMELTRAIAAQWRSGKESLLDAAESISSALDEVYAIRTRAGVFRSNDDARALEEAEGALLHKALAYYRQVFDGVNGGFGRAPKFPSPHNLMLLLAHSPHMAEKTLLQMFKGGIFDHIGGGFARYSTDDIWLAPHFEKMLYDNALLAIAYTMAFAKTGSSFYSYVSKRTLSYLLQEMRSPEGGFYSAQDADTDGEEGKFYLFTPEEVDAVLGKDVAADFCRRFDITKGGNFEGKSIPNLLVSAKDIDVELAHLLADQLSGEELRSALEKLYVYRCDRLMLHRDEKLLTGWNCLAATAFALAGRLLGDNDLVSAAHEVISFIETHLLEDDILYCSYTGGRRSGPAFLDDYAFYGLALIQLYKATDDSSYLTRAIRITKTAIDNFWDDESYGFFFSGKDNEKMIMEVKECYDGAIPSGNSAMTYVLTQLVHLMQSLQLLDAAAAADDVFELFQDTLHKHRICMCESAADNPAAHSFHLLALFPLKEITCEGNMCSLTDEDVL